MVVNVKWISATDFLEELFEFEDNITLETAIARVKDKFNIKIPNESISKFEGVIMLNGARIKEDTLLKDKDVLQFIIPIIGG